MSRTTETWPPPPIRPEPEDDPLDDWLTANDLTMDVSGRDYAVIVFAAIWSLLVLFAIAVHHHLPLGAVKNVLHTVRTILS